MDIESFVRREYDDRLKMPWKVIYGYDKVWCCFRAPHAAQKKVEQLRKFCEEFEKQLSG
jgi:hypothetical protein